MPDPKTTNLVAGQGINSAMALAQAVQPPTGQDVQTQTGYSEYEKEQLIQRILRRVKRMHSFRRQYDRKRILFYKQYLAQRDQQKYPDNITPRSNTFFPYPYSNVETVVSRAHDAFFNFDPWFESRGKGAQDEPASEAMQIVLENKLKKGGLVACFEDLVRNICIYGHAAIKVDWDWGYDTVVSAQPIPLMGPDGQPIVNPMDGQPLIIGYKPTTTNVPRNRPRFTAIDVYDLLIDPDKGIVAHLFERTLVELKRELEVNPKLYYAEGIAKIEERLGNIEDKDEVIIRMAEVWDEMNGTCSLITFGEDAEALKWKDERYANRAGVNYSSYKRKVYGGAAILLWHGPNPFMHQKAPILHTSYTKIPNEIFGLGVVETIADLTESLNRFVNMITDNWNLGINHRYAYNTESDIDHNALSNLNVPGGKVGVAGNPSEAIFPLPSFTPSAGDYAIIELYRGMIEMTSGISDFYAKGVGSPVNNKTATGISQVINESNYRFKMFIRNLEVDILQPLLQMSASLVQQYVTDEEEYCLTDLPPSIPKFYTVKPEQLLGNVDFDIVAANYVTNKSVRQRNLLAFAELAGQSPYLREREALIEMGKVFEVRNMQKLLKTDQEVAAEQAAALKQQVEMMILEGMIATESKARISQAKPPTGVGQGAGGGKPRSVSNFKGKTPGAGLTSSIREFAQNMGGNALEGLGE